MYHLIFIKIAALTDRLARFRGKPQLYEYANLIIFMASSQERSSMEVQTCPVFSSKELSARKWSAKKWSCCCDLSGFPWKNLFHKEDNIPQDVFTIKSSMTKLEDTTLIKRANRL